MFSKEFKIKGKNAMKTSERKQLHLQILRQYPNLGVEQLREYMPMEETIYKLRVVTQKGNQMYVYTVGIKPTFFKVDYDDTLYPTVFTVWKWPGLLPMFTTMEEVWPRLKNGADLMCPGVLLPPVSNPNCNAWGNYPKGMLVGINLNTNSATFAIGVTALSSDDMYMSGGRGKCVNIIHRYTDSLWAYGKDELPEHGPPTWIIICKKQNRILKTVGETIKERDELLSKRNSATSRPVKKVHGVRSTDQDAHQSTDPETSTTPPLDESCSCTHTGAIPKRRPRRVERRCCRRNSEADGDPGAEGDLNAAERRKSLNDEQEAAAFVKQCAEAVDAIDDEELDHAALNQLENLTFTELCESVCRSCIEHANSCETGSHYADNDVEQTSHTPEQETPAYIDPDIEAYVYKDQFAISAEQMDNLIKYSLFKVIKNSQKVPLKLPMLVSTFFRNYMLDVLPSTYKIDIKKSSYKKLKKFLQVMQEDGILTFNESKNVQSVTSLNPNHDAVQNFGYRPEDVDEESLKTTSVRPDLENAPTLIIEYWTITTPVFFLFSEMGFSRGESMTDLALRKHVTAYVRKRNLARNVLSRQVVMPNAAIAALLGSSEPISWENLFKKVMTTMSPCYRFDTDTKIHKGKLQPIIMTVQTRTGNKKVTLIDNMELYGINVTDFSKECQQAVGASTSISKPPGKKSSQLLVQGNQITYIYKALTDKYKIQRHYIRGIEFAPKTAKNKKK